MLHRIIIDLNKVRVSKRVAAPVRALAVAVAMGRSRNTGRNTLSYLCCNCEGKGLIFRMGDWEVALNAFHLRIGTAYLF